MIKAIVFLLMLLPALPAFSEKAAAQKKEAAASEKSKAKAPCMVCKHYGDSACMEVEVDDSTPRTQYQGKTYYFCSPVCKKEFVRKPKKYLRNLAEK